MSGYVYLLHCHGFYKIGIANDVAKRLNSIQTSNPFRVDLVASVVVDVPAELERTLHEAYAEKRTRNEWFELSDLDVCEIKQTFAQQGEPQEAAKPLKTATSFRFSDEALRLLGAISEKMGISQASVIEMALREMPKPAATVGQEPTA